MHSSVHSESLTELDVGFLVVLYCLSVDNNVVFFCNRFGSTVAMAWAVHVRFVLVHTLYKIAHVKIVFVKSVLFMQSFTIIAIIILVRRSVCDWAGPFALDFLKALAPSQVERSLFCKNMLFCRIVDFYSGGRQRDYKVSNIFANFLDVS